MSSDSEQLESSDMFAVDESESDLSEFCPYDYDNCEERKWTSICQKIDELTQCSQLVHSLLQDELSPENFARRVLAEAF